MKWVSFQGCHSLQKGRHKPQMQDSVWSGLCTPIGVGMKVQGYGSNREGRDPQSARGHLLMSTVLCKYLTCEMDMTVSFH